MSQVVLLNGWGYTANLWSGLRREAGMEALLVAEPCQNAHSIDEWADQLADDLPANSSIIGWSLGAMLALCLAKRHPDRVGRMLLIGATPCFVAKRGWAYGLAATVVAQFQADFAQNPQRTLKRFLALQVFGDQARASVTPKLGANLSTDESSINELECGLRILTTTDLRQSLPDTCIPCTLVHGDNDSIIPLAAASYLQQRLPGSRLIVRERTGHAPLITEEAFLAALIREELR